MSRINAMNYGIGHYNVGGNGDALDHTYTLQVDPQIGGRSKRIEPLPEPRTTREPTDQELLDWCARYGCELPDNLTIKVY